VRGGADNLAGGTGQGALEGHPSNARFAGGLSRVDRVIQLQRSKVQMLLDLLREGKYHLSGSDTLTTNRLLKVVTGRIELPT
jgi:hypothetical protein